jgi:ATP-dependent DNA helicase RecQ
MFSSASPAKHRRPKFALPVGKALKELLAGFGIARLRPGQKEVIDCVLAGRDTLAILPTGGGKSLCYQIPALVMPGTTVVVSPLIALMKDQVEKLEEAGIAAEQMNSSLNTTEEEQARHNLLRTHSEIVFVTPERLQDEDFLADLQKLHIDLFVVDEAHCISQWGHDFRPAFLGLAHVVRKLGRPLILALTATATEEVARDIARQLGMRQPKIINNGIYRSNLHYQVMHVTNEDEKLTAAVQLVKEHKGAGIVYAATVKAVDALYDALKAAGEPVARYHGKLPAGQRKENQDLFMGGDARVMVATNAFGMGIDKPDTRFVIHYQLPANLEAYYQESGRAGRDGTEAKCILLYFAQDKRVQQFFLAKYVPVLADLRAMYKVLSELAGQGRGVHIDDLRKQLREPSTGKVRVALNLLKEAELVRQARNGALRLTDKAADVEVLEKVLQICEERLDHDKDALERMVGYAQSGSCRWQLLMTYFGDEGFARCGTCDNCLAPPPEIIEPEVVREEEPQETDGIEVGSYVRVPKYHEGEVVGLAGNQVTVVFPDNMTRTFLRSYVALLKPGRPTEQKRGVQQPRANPAGGDGGT